MPALNESTAFVNRAALLMMSVQGCPRMRGALQSILNRKDTKAQRELLWEIAGEINNLRW